MSEKKQADVQELVQELSHCNDVQSLQETAHSMGKDLSEEDSRGLFDLLGTAASNQVFSSLVSGNQASSGLNLGTLLNFASGQTQQAQVQQKSVLHRRAPDPQQVLRRHFQPAGQRLWLRILMSQEQPDPMRELPRIRCSQLPEQPQQVLVHLRQVQLQE